MQLLNSIPISIITINYNDKIGLERTIKSIVNQTYQDFEYLVIDGKSYDGSVEVLEQYKDHFDYWISEPDTGIYNAMNKGIAKAKGKYLLFINSGDELYSPTVLEENYSKIHTEDLVYFDLEQVYEDHTNIHHFPLLLSYTNFITGTIGHPSTFIKKELFYKLGPYDEKLKIVADWKFFTWAFIKYHCTTRKIEAVLSKFYMDGISTKEVDFTNQERRIVLKNDFPEYVRLIELETFVEKLKKSRLIKMLNSIGLLKSIKNI